MVLDYAEGGDLNFWMNLNYGDFDWKNKLLVLLNIIIGLEEIHRKQMVHHDFHTGNILLNIKNLRHSSNSNNVRISDMGLCGEINNIDKTKIYGVMPYLAPEVLKGKPYTQAADIYSFGMIMYFVVTGKQPFANCAHDEILALNICNGIRPEINEPEAPKCYIDLMKKCWDSNPDNRPSVAQMISLLNLFHSSYEFSRNKKTEKEQEIEKQFQEAEEYRRSHPSFFDESRLLTTTHPQAIYKSRLLDAFTKDLPKYNDNIDNNTVENFDLSEYMTCM